MVWATKPRLFLLHLFSNEGIGESTQPVSIHRFIGGIIDAAKLARFCLGFRGGNSSVESMPVSTALDSILGKEWKFLNSLPKIPLQEENFVRCHT